MLESNQSQVWFLPEGMIYDWSPATEFFWKTRLQGTRVMALVGGYESKLENRHVTSRVYVLGDVEARQPEKDVLRDLSASMTFPLTMWRPWAQPDHIPMHLPNPVVSIDGHRTFISWCYESTLAWPHVLASMQAPEVFVSLENRWVSSGTSLEAAQTVAGTLNARWLGAALLQAINR